MKKLLLIMALAFGLVAVAPAGTSLAFDFFPDHAVDCDVAEESAVCNEETEDDPISGEEGALMKIVNIIAYLAGAAAIIIMLVAGLHYITSDGDPGKIKSAKGTFMNAVIGLVVIVAAQALIAFVLRRI